jgi:toxin CcdB
MARFEVFTNAGPHRATTPYLVDVQGNHLESLITRVVIPLRRTDSFPEVKLPKDLIPVFVIEGVEYLLDTPQLAAVPRVELRKPVTSLAN